MTPVLEKLEGVRFLHCAEPTPGAQVDPARIRLVFGGEPSLARPLPSRLYVAIRSEECGRKIGDLLLGEAGEQGYSIDIECQATFEGGSPLGDLETNTLDGVSDVATLCFMHIGNCREQFGGEFHGGSGADQVPLSEVRSENANLSVVPDDAGDEVVSERGDHQIALRVSRGDRTIVPGGPATSPVVNSRYRFAGGN